MKAIAPILKNTTGKICFSVDNVTPTPYRLPVESGKLQLEKSLGSPLLAFSHDEEFTVIKSAEIHPLVHAVHAAFSQHRPLLLTPDIIWLTIAQGFSQHINNHSETLRSRFVQHQGKKELVFETMSDLETIPWATAVEKWTLQVRDHVGADLYRLLECNFSTTTPITRIASHIVMMDTFKQYFEYAIRCVCGIPHITLLGTVEDWQSISDRVKIMAEYELSWWTDRLIPICQEFAEAAAGKPAIDFWRCIYKPKTVYGGELMTGWLTDLFPYIKDPVTNTPTVKNPMLERYFCEPPPAESQRNQSFSWGGYGISPKSLPLGICQVPAKFTGGKKNVNLELIAGFIGVQQNSETGILQPEIGWAVRDKASDRFGELLDQIEEQHLTQPPINWEEFKQSCGLLGSVPKEIMQMLDHFDGATLYPNTSHPWYIAKCDRYKFYELPRSDSLECYGANHLIELADGRCIAYADIFDNYLILLGNPVQSVNTFSDEQDEFMLENVKVIAESIPQLFEDILTANGHYYFDDLNFLST